MKCQLLHQANSSAGETVPVGGPPETVWTLCIRYESLAPTGIQTTIPQSPTYQPVRYSHHPKPIAISSGLQEFPFFQFPDNGFRSLVKVVHLLLPPRSGKSRAIPLPPLWAFGPVTGYLYLLVKVVI
jgi:hypothetical protein